MMDVSIEQEGKDAVHCKSRGHATIKEAGEAYLRKKYDQAPLMRSCRLTLALYCFLGSTIMMSLRMCLGFAMVCMIRHKPVNSSLTPESFPGDSVCQQYRLHETDIQETYGEGDFDWDKGTQGLVLSAYFKGYMLTQILGGWVADKVGPKKLYLSGMWCVAVLSMLIPSFSWIGAEAVFAIRFLQGVATGFIIPSIHSFFSYWGHSRDRSLLMSIAYAGYPVGTTITFPICSFLCKYGFANGWPSIFYMFGLLGMLWVLCGIFGMYNTPSDHPRISAKELEYLEDSVTNRILNKKKASRVPWVKIMTSLPVLAISVSHFCMNWGFYTFAMYLPVFMKEVLYFDITQNGFLSAFPYCVMLIVQITTGKIADLVTKKEYFSMTVQRKIFNSLGFLLPCIGTLVLTFLTCENRYIATAVLIVSQGAQTIAFAGGFLYNHIEIAPQFVGVLLGVSNTISNIPGFLVPPVVAGLTANSTHGWYVVFYITMALYLLGGVFYAAFSSSELQSWAMDPQPTEAKQVETDQCMQDEESNIT